jgi:ATP-binding cassette, subfamily B, bacterial PglK
MTLFRDIWRLLDRRGRLSLLLSPLLALLVGVSTLGGIAAVIPFFAVLGDPATIHRSALLGFAYTALGFTDDRAFLVALGLAFVAMLLLSNAVSMLGFRAITRYSYRVGERFHAALLSEYLHRNLLFHTRSHGAQLINNIVYEAQRVAGGVVHGALMLLSNAVTGVLIVAAVVAVNPRIAAAATVALGGSYGLAYLLVRRRVVAYGAIETLQAETRMRIVTESLGGIRDILLSGSQAGVLRRFAAACAAISRAASSTMTIAQAPRHVIECVTGAGLVATALLLTAHNGASGAWLAPVTFLGLAAYRLLPALQQMFAAVVRIRGDRAAFDRIQQDLALGSERLKSPPAMPERGVFQGAPRIELRLNAVSFGYAADGPRALREASLRIQAGTLVGLVGANGSGKTTLADLALGLLVPDSGSVEVDGIRLDDSSRAAWRAATAYVPQTIFLSDTTIAENIANGGELEDIDWERLRAVGAMARLDEFVAELPDGYRTPIGERGARLSGGQRQRLGIARALYRDASMLVLDEATSALDGLAEREVLQALEALRHKATVLLIAHRLDTLARCDLIIELVNGAIVNRGRFEELLASSERLRRIAELDAPLRRHS